MNFGFLSFNNNDVLDYMQVRILIWTIKMAVVPADRASEATEEVEMDDLDKSSNGNVMYINTDNCVLRRTFSAPSGVAKENENNLQISSVSPSLHPVSSCKTNDITLQLPRMRTCSVDSSQMTLNVDCNSTSASPVSIGSPARRIMQIRREESVDELTREVAKERDVTSALNLSKSLDETSWLGEKNYMMTNEMREKPDSIDVARTSHSSSTPSPVRFVDKLPHNRSLTPSPIGVPISPKQRTYRRSSISPSNLRPSLLSSKRKLDTDDRDPFMCTPAKRNALFYSPTSSNTLSSISSNSSPDHISDTSSNQCSCDDDSGSDQGFTPTTINSSCMPINSLLSCDTHSFAFNKLQYVAPQSPLAAGAGNASLNHENKRKSLGSTSYTFTPVKD